MHQKQEHRRDYRQGVLPDYGSVEKKTRLKAGPKSRLQTESTIDHWIEYIIDQIIKYSESNLSSGNLMQDLHQPNKKKTVHWPDYRPQTRL